MKLLDQFAIAAMTAHGPEKSNEDAARMSYELAEAMVRERTKVAERITEEKAKHEPKHDHTHKGR